jgi:hypothetical protein
MSAHELALQGWDAYEIYIRMHQLMSWVPEFI